MGGGGAPPSSPSCSRSFCPWRDSLATSSAAVQLSDFVATLSPASQALRAPAPAPGALPAPGPAPGALSGPTHIPSALLCAWLRRATCPPTVHLHSVPSRPRPFTLTFPSLPRPGSSSRLAAGSGWPEGSRGWGQCPSAASLVFLEFVSVHLSFPSRRGLSDWNWRMHVHLGATGWAGNQPPGPGLDVDRDLLPAPQLAFFPLSFTPGWQCVL